MIENLYSYKKTLISETTRFCKTINMSSNGVFTITSQKVNIISKSFLFENLYSLVLYNFKMKLLKIY